MLYTNIADIDIPVSKLGFGTWGLGGDAYGPVDYGDAIKAIEFAFDSGINFFDCADIYGNGKAEKILGNALKKNRSSVLISSKVGYLKYPSTEQSFNEKFIRSRLEASLRRLNSEYIDIYYLHSPSTEVLMDDSVTETFLKLKNEGKIRKIAASVRTISDGLIAVNTPEIDIIQAIYNILDQRAFETGLVKEINSANKTMVSRVPLCFGLITGKYNSQSIFGKNDHRKRWGASQIEAWVKMSKIFENYFKDLNNYSVAQNALKFSISPGCNSITIPGMKSISQVKQNLLSIEIPDYSNSVYEELFSLYKKHKCLPK